MHHHRWLYALALTACFTDDPPLVAASDDDGEDASSSSSGPPDPPTVTSAPSSASSTTQPPEDDDGSSSGGSSSSSGSESDDSSSGGDSSSSSTGPAPYDGAYHDCWEGPVQQKEGEYICAPHPCVVSLPDHSACAPECGAGCELGPEDVGAVCLDTIADGTVPAVCVITCGGDGAPCPDAMECKVTEFEAAGEPLWMCMWP